MNKIAVLITCHNRREKTLSCLTSLFNCKLPINHSLDIFLVDDGSTDGTTDAIKTKFPSVLVIPGNGYLYWNRGMHLAWDTAAKLNDYDYFLWLNDDVELFPNAIEDLLPISIENNSIVVGALKSKKNPTTTYSGLNLKDELITPSGKPQVCQLFNGNFVLIQKDIFKIIGNLDPIFTHAIGDFDYALRAKKKKIVSYVGPNYVGYCEKNTSLPQWCLPTVPFIKRVKVLYSPVGYAQPYYFFIFEIRHFGPFVAIKHFLSIHIRLLFPQLWK